MIAGSNAISDRVMMMKTTAAHGEAKRQQVALHIAASLVSP